MPIRPADLWRDRIIVVTGGTSGIGREFAVRFAIDGARVIACGRNDTALREIQTEHPTIEVVQCDIAVRPNVLALVETIRDRCGVVDVLVNNADIANHYDGVMHWIAEQKAPA
jgi:uncharacterized oxidoreductase